MQNKTSGVVLGEEKREYSEFDLGKIQGVISEFKKGLEDWKNVDGSETKSFGKDWDSCLEYLIRTEEKEISKLKATKEIMKAIDSMITEIELLSNQCTKISTEEQNRMYGIIDYLEEIQRETMMSMRSDRNRMNGEFENFVKGSDSLLIRLENLFSPTN